ncbi:MAG: hypothetical protein ACI9TV_000241 [Sulfurimonas sp.]|jgi:hypothetical protein|uniref:hypothetical protein n=1 Tax=Sulfurimonas sp. TaxID=2022749 RepID=UPI0039E70D8A
MKYILMILMLFLSACSIKNYEKTQAKIIIIKSLKIKFADIGYLRSTDKAIELEMFIAGHAVQKIQINHLICVKEGCMSKGGFNEDYLHHSYPDDILQNILLGHEIYDGKSKSKTDSGFEQKIVNDDVDIKYRVNDKEIFFKDSKNKIIFKIKDTK